MPRHAYAQTALKLEHDRIPVVGGSLTLAIVADTHSKRHPRTAKLVSEAKPDFILHAGDIGDLEVLETFAKIAPLFAIRGNIDVRARDLPDVRVLELVERDDLLIKILLLHIAVNGPKLRADAIRVARENKADLVICGHSHVPFIGRDRDLSIFNPGSVGPRRFQLPIVFGVLELNDRRIIMKHVNCETGETWLP